MYLPILEIKKNEVNKERKGNCLRMDSVPSSRLNLLLVTRAYLRGIRECGLISETDSCCATGLDAARYCGIPTHRGTMGSVT